MGENAEKNTETRGKEYYGWNAPVVGVGEEADGALRAKALEVGARLVELAVPRLGLALAALRAQALQVFLAQQLLQLRLPHAQRGGEAVARLACMPLCMLAPLQPPRPLACRASS